MIAVHERFSPSKPHATLACAALRASPCGRAALRVPRVERRCKRAARSGPRKRRPRRRAQCLGAARPRLASGLIVRERARQLSAPFPQRAAAGEAWLLRGHNNTALPPAQLRAPKILVGAPCARVPLHTQERPREQSGARIRRRCVDLVPNSALFARPWRVSTGNMRCRVRHLQRHKRYRALLNKRWRKGAPPTNWGPKRASQTLAQAGTAKERVVRS